MTEAHEVVLRRSLDSVDRRQLWMKIIAVVFIGLGSVNIALAMIYLQDMRMLYIATFVGLILWTGGLAVAMIGVSNKNAQLILRAIALASEAAGGTSVSASTGTHRREG
ncbi:MAG: hypothetical protein ABR987_00750 [Terracidiphilus sp.]|jgi:hypothetical protein